MNNIANNASVLLGILAEQPRPEGGNAEFSGRDLAEVSNLSPNEINDSITVLVESGLVEWLQTLGTGPYDFNVVWITARGRYEYERTKIQIDEAENTIMEEEVRIVKPPSPVGSPFGFLDYDWEMVSERKSRSDILFVVLGYQFVSEFYDTEHLLSNVQNMFEDALEVYNQKPSSIPITLNYQPLVAGYGEHLFNEIARDIISADIAVFETSDLNPNVMVELGVALTWGVRVLPIKREDRPIPPADISGQTWADYQRSASLFTDPDHQQKLVRMIERAARKKGHS